MNTARSAARLRRDIGDYEFGNHPQDMALLENMSQVAAAPTRRF
jgi:predicted component of type VI protein secretion system